MGDAVTTDTLLGGRYRLLRMMARDGTAAVWEAEDLVLSRRVAVKVSHSHLAADDGLRERFRREAVAVARLSHPAVVAVYDTGEDEGVAFLVMELVEGRTLADVLGELGPLPVATAVEIVAQVAAGLAVAHERGILHRDVKPGNILVLPDGRAKLTDFGIARGDTGGDDVYDLGLVLYEALCGRPAGTVGTESLAPRQVRVDIPREVEAVVMRALARDPGGRFRTAGELRAALVALHLAPVDDTPPAGAALTVAGDRHFTLGVVGVILVGVLVALAGFFFAATGTGRSVLQGVRDRLPGGDPKPVPIAGTADFDPFGNDGAENPEDTPLAHDGDPGTAWETDRYHSPAFGNLKPGVGLRIDLGEEDALRRLTVLTDVDNGGDGGGGGGGGRTWEAEVYVGDGTARDLAGWGEPVARRHDLGERARFDLEHKRGRSVLLWITHLPGSGRLAVAEVDVAA